ncbi:MAG: aminotransferase class I/II-fold pyridoxal phosphate-dependent enzyme [Pseudomonadota bacterium]
MRFSSRGNVEPFRVMDVMEAARQLEASGRDVVHMEVGQPGTPAPKTATDRLMAEIATGAPMGYTVALGLPELRRGVAQLYRNRHGIDLNPDRVIVTPGSSGAFILAFLALFDAGDQVAMATPSYPAYKNILRALDIAPVGVSSSIESGFQPDLAQLPENPGFQGLLVASPANPTGTMLSDDQLKGVAQWSAATDVSLISDEIYHGLSYESPAKSALEVTDDVIVVNSFAKYFSMTGWRIGWMVVPESMIRRVENLAQNFFICSSHASQVAAMGALEGTEELEGHRAVYARNRKQLMDALPGLGFTDIAPPDGAFYIYAKLPDLGEDSPEFCRRLLQDGGVATTTGLDFDDLHGHQTLRFSFARTEAEIAEGIRRLSEFMQKG